MKHDTLLFIGDSITDADRRTDPEGIGFGYVRIVRDMILCREPQRAIRVINAGVGGDTIRHLERRWSEDVLAPNPTWLAVSIGVNDVWRQLQQPPNPEAVYIDEFVATYRKLLSAVRDSVSVRGIFVCEPTPVGEDPESAHNRIMRPYLDAVAEVAAEFEATLVPMQQAFWIVKGTNPLHNWTADGVHPKSEGHMLMALTFLKEWERAR